MMPREERIRSLLRAWQDDGFIVRYIGEWRWTTKAQRELTPRLTELTPRQAAEGVDDGSLGVTLN